MRTDIGAASNPNKSSLVITTERELGMEATYEDVGRGSLEAYAKWTWIAEKGKSLAVAGNEGPKKRTLPPSEPRTKEEEFWLS